MIKLEVGKYYKTRDGRKVGPMREMGSEFDVASCGYDDIDYQVWSNDGSVYKEQPNENGQTLIAEWQDEPATRDYKVGDKVRILSGGYAGIGLDCGDIGKVSLATSCGVELIGSDGEDWTFLPHEIEPYLPQKSDMATQTASKTWQDIHTAIKQMLIDRAYLAIENDDDLVAIKAMQKLRELEAITPAQ